MTPPRLDLESGDDAKSVESSVNSVPAEGSKGESDSYTSGHGTTSGNTSTKEEEESEKIKLAQKETAAVFRLRLLVFAVLMLAAVAVSIIVYFITSNSEKDEYETQYSGVVALVGETFLDIFESKMGAVSALGVALIAHTVDHETQTWPFVTLSKFQQRAETARKQSKALYVHINPIVNDYNRDEWEKFINGPDAQWINEGISYQDSLGVFDFLGHNMTRADAALVPPGLSWGESPIWYHDSYAVTHVDEGPGPYLPTWQTSPVVYAANDINENILKSFRTAAPSLALERGMVTISEFVTSPKGGVKHPDIHTSLYALLMSAREGKEVEYDGDALSQVFFPIYNSFEEDREAVAIMAAWIHWRYYFENILPDSLTGLNIVLSDSCGGAYTYELHGPKVIPIGQGDLHQSGYEGKKETFTLASIKNIADGTRYGLPVNQEQCLITLDIYPSDEFYHLFNTRMPAIMTAAVAIIFVFTALMFLFYDRLVERRQALVMQRALQTTAIVSSLFPDAVRDKLIESASANKNDGNQKNGMFVAQNARVKGFLSGAQDENDGAPIAELYPNCTVLFSDISGFTAWSSTREPAQVFILLQTLYQAFDIIAKRRKVFKVETIGDSYLAVSGLPEPNPNHATVCCRFAWDCLNKMNEVTRQLEVSLGPDTGDLSMRFGLHSGPVTAGVLRGERARFQLFGDTVNTASRMESTGMRGKVQVSKATADLLEAAGKSSWLRPRKDQVTAKGKGKLQTFWVSPTSQRGSSVSSGASGVSAQETKLNAVDRAVVTSQKAQGVNDRLVAWMCDLLMKDIQKIVHSHHIHGVKAAKTPFSYLPPDGSSLLDEVETVIEMPSCQEKSQQCCDGCKCHNSIREDVVTELREFVTAIARLYHDENPFHNFEHACHVTMSVRKLLQRIVAPDITEDETDAVTRGEIDHNQRLHDYTHGIHSDPFLPLALTFSALIHDVDHRGVSNMQLMNEAKDLADKYENKSIAEQNSLDIAWGILQRSQFDNLRRCIFSSEADILRFRQLIVNVVLATDIFDKELNDLRKSRWNKAFHSENEEKSSDSDLRATIVIEHIIQASDVSHTMQHWHVYRKWNKCLFKEMWTAWNAGRMGKDPSTFWYQGELGFFDNYVIPLAKKLKECGVFGVSSDEYLAYALQNRAEWEERGDEMVKSLVAELEEQHAKNGEDKVEKA